jgi:flagellin-specific chaperone FliS
MDYDGLVSELRHAADTVSDNKNQEIRSLLDRAVTAIRHLRLEIDRHPADNVRDAVTLFENTSASLAAGSVSVEQCQTALKDASIMIRDLVVKSRSDIR